MKKYLPLLIVAVILVIHAGLVYAGEGGAEEFGGVYDMISGWTSGTLGKIIAVGTFLVGMGIGVARQSLMPIVLGVGGALALNYTPEIIDAVITALI